MNKLAKTTSLNFGKLLGKVSPTQNIVYYRRGLDELSLNITNACPNACVFCIRDRDPGWNVTNLYLNRDPSVDEIVEAFDSEYKKIIGNGVILNKVKICGYGEMKLRCSDLPPILQHIRRKSDSSIQLTTTGWPYFRLISQDTSKLQELATSGLTHIYLSMSAPNEESYKKLVKPGIKNHDSSAFRDAIRFGISAKSMGLDVTLGFIKLPGVQLLEVQDFANRLGLKYKIRKMEE